MDYEKRLGELARLFEDEPSDKLILLATIVMELMIEVQEVKEKNALT